MKTLFTILLLLLSASTFGQTKDKYKPLFDSLMTMSHYDELIGFLEPELKKHPKSEALLRKLGYVYIAKNNLDLEMADYEKVLSALSVCYQLDWYQAADLKFGIWIWNFIPYAV